MSFSEDETDAVCKPLMGSHDQEKCPSSYGATDEELDLRECRQVSLLAAIMYTVTLLIKHRLHIGMFELLKKTTHLLGQSSCT